MGKLAIVNIPANELGPCRIPAGVDLAEFSGVGTSLAEMVVGFFEDGEGSQKSCSTDGEEEEEGEGVQNSEAENAAFWQTQHSLLEAALCRRSSLESRVRRDALEAVKNERLVPACVCQKPVASSCRNCLRRKVIESLRKAGYDAAVCKSKWRSSRNIPAGEHVYIDVVELGPTKKAATRVVVELDFRSEFEMARGSEEYNRLISRLPELYVGKPERLKTIIKTACAAAKRCMKEKKMHLGPWRKHKYMEAKWFGSYERTAPEQVFPARFSDRQPKLRASLLTFDLLEKLPSLNCTAFPAVAVV